MLANNQIVGALYLTLQCTCSIKTSSQVTKLFISKYANTLKIIYSVWLHIFWSIFNDLRRQLLWTLCLRNTPNNNEIKLNSLNNRYHNVTLMAFSSTILYIQHWLAARMTVKSRYISLIITFTFTTKVE